MVIDHKVTQVGFVTLGMTVCGETLIEKRDSVSIRKRSCESIASFLMAIKKRIYRKRRHIDLKSEAYARYTEEKPCRMKGVTPAHIPLLENGQRKNYNLH